MIRLLRSGYGEFDATRPLGPACWLHHDLLFVHRGVLQIEFAVRGETVRLRRGEGVLIWPDTPFRGAVAAGAVRASIQHFAVQAPEAGALAGLLAKRAGWCRQTVPARRHLTADVERALEGGRAWEADFKSRVMRVALLELILAQAGMLDSDGPSERRCRMDTRELGRWLTQNLSTSPGVSELAVQAGLSVSRFRAVFKAENGRSAGWFVRRVREAEARRLLTETNDPLKAIAARLGHADAVVFSRAFKQATGRTPGDYRREFRIVG